MLFNKTLKQLLNNSYNQMFAVYIYLRISDTDRKNKNFWNKLGATVLLKKVFAALPAPLQN